MNTDLVYTSDSSQVREGLVKMLEALCHETYSDAEMFVRPWMNGADVLLLIEVAKRAEDLPEWFPRGKWATIQCLQASVEKAIESLCSTPTGKVTP